MKYLALVYAIATFATAANANTGTSYRLNPEDQAIIERSVADETAVPDRTQITGIAAAINAQGVISACGYVRWLDGSGLYGPYRPFQGILATNTSGQRVFAIFSIARDPRDHLILETLCAEDGAPIGQQASASAVSPPDHVAKLIDEAQELNGRCRGTEGADPASTVCDDRNAAFSSVNALGWCHGKNWQVGYQHEWHQCGPDSIGR